MAYIICATKPIESKGDLKLDVRWRGPSGELVDLDRL